MMEYITRKMIEDGLMSHVIQPNIEAGALACWIGEYWFWFGGSEFEHTNPKDMSFHMIVDEIKTVLDAFYEDALHGDEVYKNEYLYYYYYLIENI